MERCRGLQRSFGLVFVVSFRMVSLSVLILFNINICIMKIGQQKVKIQLHAILHLLYLSRF